MISLPNHLHHILFISLLFLITPLCCGISAPLTLQEAESLTIQKNMQLDKSDSDTTITDRLLSKDSKPSQQDSGLTFGVQKILPDEGDPISQSDNTIYKVGIQQKIPNADVYFIKNRRTQAMNVLANRKQKDHLLSLSRETRNIWLSLYFLSQAQKKLEETKISLLALSQNHNAHDQKQKVLQAIKPSLAALTAQNANLQSQIDNFQLKLAILVGKNNAQRPMPQGLPIWPDPPTLIKLQARLLRHPKLQEDSAAIQAIRASTTLVKAQNKSSIGIGASYGVRQGEFMEGNPTPDTFSAEIKLNLYSKADQQSSSQQLRPHIAELEAAQLKQERDFRELTADLRENYKNWENFSQQAIVLKQQLSQETDKTKTALNAYIKNPHTSIKPVIEACDAELRFTLNMLAAQMSAAKARVNLMYYE